HIYKVQKYLAVKKTEAALREVVSGWRVRRDGAAFEAVLPDKALQRSDVGDPFPRRAIHDLNPVVARGGRESLIHSRGEHTSPACEGQQQRRGDECGGRKPAAHRPGSAHCLAYSPLDGRRIERLPANGRTQLLVTRLQPGEVVQTSGAAFHVHREIPRLRRVEFLRKPERHQGRYFAAIHETSFAVASCGCGLPSINFVRIA